MAVKRKPLPQAFEVPVDIILAFAHKDLPDDFEGLFFRRYDKKDEPLEFREWNYELEHDSRFYLTFPPCEGKPPKEVGDIGVDGVDYMLVYQHGGIQEILGTYGTFRSRYFYEGTDEKGKHIQGNHNGWSLCVITNPKDKKSAEYGFLNAAGVSCLSVFYAAGMRQVVVEPHETNWRSNSFVRWMGFKNPIHVHEIAKEYGIADGWIMPAAHKLYSSRLSTIIRHMLKQGDLRRAKHLKQYGTYRQFVFSDKANPIDVSGQKLMDQQCDNILKKFDAFIEKHKNSGRN